MKGPVAQHRRGGDLAVSHPGRHGPPGSETMENLRFEQDEIQEPVIERKYDKVMGMYLILSARKTKVKGHAIR